MSKQPAITSLGSYLPSKIITNEDLEKTIDTTDQWIKSRTGIRQRRRVNEDDNCSDIAVLACQKALDNSSLDREDIDLIICTSLSPDKLCPSTASIIQGKLNLRNAAAFDLSSACAGFSFALSVAASFIKSNTYKNILVVGAEVISRLINYEDRNTCILFGDGAGAALVQAVDAPFGIIGSYLATDGSKVDLIEIQAGGSSIPASRKTVEQKQHFLQMKGQEVFKFAVRVIPDAIENVLAKTELSLQDIDLFIPHQANLRIIDAAAKKLGIDKKKFFTNLEYFGNTSTASVPIALEQATQQGLLKKGDLVVIIGFGAGLSWGANVMKWAY